MRNTSTETSTEASTGAGAQTTAVTTAEDGLRAKKRAATKSTIEHSAVSLALEHGYEHVTVEMICDASMVSQRTFFNYFGSKESVILGTVPALPDEDRLRGFVQSSEPDVLSELVQAITATFIGQEPDRALFRSRREVIGRTPELFTSQLSRMIAQEDQLAELVLERFRAQGRDETSTSDLAEEARMVVTLVASIMRHSMQEWFKSKNMSVAPDTFQHSIELIHRITGQSQSSSPSTSTK